MTPTPYETALTAVATTFTTVKDVLLALIAIPVVAIPVYIALAAGMVVLAKRIIPGLGGRGVAARARKRK